MIAMVRAGVGAAGTAVGCAEPLLWVGRVSVVHVVVVVRRRLLQRLQRHTCSVYCVWITASGRQVRLKTMHMQEKKQSALGEPFPCEVSINL